MCEWKKLKEEEEKILFINKEWKIRLLTTLYPHFLFVIYFLCMCALWAWKLHSMRTMLIKLFSHYNDLEFLIVSNGIVRVKHTFLTIIII